MVVVYIARNVPTSKRRATLRIGIEFAIASNVPLGLAWLLLRGRVWGVGTLRFAIFVIYSTQTIFKNKVNTPISLTNNIRTEIS